MLQYNMEAKLEIYDNFPQIEDSPFLLMAAADWCRDKYPEVKILWIYRHGFSIARLFLDGLDEKLS